ncbi:polysaccharide biosynthesis tyrosine autokinase [Acinetobacter sp. ANC 4636]
MNTTQQTDDTIDLKELFYSLILQWKLIAVCMLLSFICAILYLRVTPATYAVNGLVQIESGKGGASAALLGQQLSSVMDSGLGQQQAQAEIQILQSRLVLGTTIQTLNLNIQVSPTQNSLLQRIITKSDFQTQYSVQDIAVHNDSDNFTIQELKVPESFEDKALILHISGDQLTLTDKRTDLVVFKGKLNQYNIASNTEGTWRVAIFAKMPINQDYILTKQSLPSAVQTVQSNLTASETVKQTGIINVSYQGQDGLHITHVLNTILSTYKAQNVQQSSAEKEQTLAFLNKQLPQLKADLDDAERKFNAFREANNTVDVNQESELYLKQSIDLETQKTQLQQKQAELAAKYTSEHPMMQEVNAQLDAINKKIGELDTTLKRLPDIQRRYLQFYRDVEVKNQLYTNLLNTYQTMSVAKAGEIGNVRIVDMAIEPIKPIKPKKLIILVFSIVIGGFIGILLALLRSMMQSGIKDASQIEDEFNISVYATVPRSELQLRRTHLLKKKRQLPILAVKDTEDGAVESLRSLRTAIYFALGKEHGNQAILISGTSPEIGKSFIAINLATILAQSGKRVLLIDGDMRRGYLQQYFANSNNLGLSNLLTDNVTELNQVIQNTNVENLAFIARGKSPKNPAELLNNGKFAAIIEQLKQYYDHIVIDTPPLLAVTDAAIISQSVDLNLLVVRFGKSHLKEVDITINRFKQSGREVHGVILNDIHKTSGAYGYGYDYQYSYDYKSRK